MKSGREESNKCVFKFQRESKHPFGSIWMCVLISTAPITAACQKEDSRVEHPSKTCRHCTRQGEIQCTLCCWGGKKHYNLLLGSKTAITYYIVNDLI